MDTERCSRCYGDVRGECIRVGLCVIRPRGFGRRWHLINWTMLWLPLALIAVIVATSVAN